MSSPRNLHRATLAALTFSVSCWLTTGCSICAHPYDYSYTYYGARWQRSDMERGRVGSAFYPAGEQLMSDGPVAPYSENPEMRNDSGPTGNSDDPLQPKDGSAPTKNNESREEGSPSDRSGDFRYRQDAQRAFGRR